MHEIHGTVAPGFEPVRDAFELNFEEGRERGACVAITQNGEPVVDIWAGDADGEGRPWERDTIVNVYSTTKTMAAISLLRLADRGEVDLYAPVAKYWPEFEQNGKEGVLVSHVMSHSAGVSGFELPGPANLYDWDDLCERLASQAPWWEPGTKPGYHAVTQGFLQGEILRRITGTTIGNYFRTEIAEPLGADFHIGLDEKHDHRVAALVPPDMSAGAMPANAAMNKDSIRVRTFLGADLKGTEPATREWRAAEIPAAGGTGNARAVARVHSMMACGGEVDGIRIMSESGALRAIEEQIRGHDEVMGIDLVYGMGFGISDPTYPISPSKRACFWGGWGGSLAVIDFDQKVSIAYVMNHMEADLMGDPRGGRIVKATYESLGG